MKPERYQIGQIIRTLRKESGLTQLALAQLVGVTRVTVMRWELGLRTPSLSMLDLIAEACGSSLCKVLSQNCQ